MTRSPDQEDSMQTPYYEAGPVVLHHGDCKSVMAAMPDASVDAIVTDPPYELTAGKRGGSGQASVNLNSPYGRSRIGTGGFMGKHWDATGIAHDVEMWREAYRVLKPGGHLLAFGGSRTYHRMAVAIEDAGFEVRDSIAWLYGSGFPKSLDVSKAIDKAGGASPADQAAVLVAARERAGLSREEVAEHVGCTPSSVADWERGRARAVGAAVEFVTPSSEYRAKLAALLGYTADERRVVGLTVDRRGDGTVVGLGHSGTVYSGPETTAAKAWEGWGTALKPAFEPIVVARKPLAGTVAANVLAFGTGALNIDATRTAGDNPSVARRQGSTKHLQQRSAKESEAAGKIESRMTPERYREERAGELLGRWPTNVVLDWSQAAVLDAQSGHQRDGVAVNRNRGSVRPQTVAGSPTTIVDKSDVTYGGGGGASRFFPTFRYEAKAPTSERPVVDGVAHATVKPLALMRWLVRLVTPPGGVVLDPFAGSGTTLEAAVLEGFDSIGIELEEAHLPLIKSRFKKPFDQYLDLGDIA